MLQKSILTPTHTAYSCRPFPRFIPPLHSFSSHKRLSYLFLCIASNLDSEVICSSTISASSAKKRRKVKSNPELCNDIREFLSAVGLPEDHFPTTKELSQHGRQDLANVVRRRGYKFMKELLACSGSTDTNHSASMKIMDDKQVILSTGEDNLTELCTSGKRLGLDHDSSEAATLSSYSPMMTDLSSFQTIERQHLNSSDRSCTTLESSMWLTLQEKMAQFIHNGELNEIEDFGFDIVSGGAADEDKTRAESQNPMGQELSSLSEEGKCIVHQNADVKIFNGHERYSYDGFTSQKPEEDIVRNDIDSNDAQGNADDNEYTDFERQKKEEQTEIERLKSELHLKELKLHELKQLIEKEKLALSVLKDQAESEIAKAQELVSEKDAELQAAEECLSELVVVEIQFLSDMEAEVVEVAGSYSGWQHRTRMVLQPSANDLDPIVSRKPRLWSTILWLYPGVYEIKFIVDGKWKIDPKRESIFSDGIHNNVLRVNR